MVVTYKPTIGLEIHAELKTQTKMFCDSLNDPEEKRPNCNVCPVCLGHPGTLPVINKKAVEAVIRAGLALHGTVNQLAKFDRKNYFYPDLPKGYQISQYDKPIVSGGRLNDIRIRRVHLEEDTGTLSHGADRKAQDKKDKPLAPGDSRFTTLVDFNRAGVPLMELVTEPDLQSADEAVAFAREFQLILRYLGVSSADMEKGQMRVEANVSVGVAEEGKKTMGTKVEVKNINSFKAVRDAIEHEIKRQEKVLRRGEEVRQETRGWDEVKRETVSQRSKEEAHDYRYFPEPDLPPFDTSAFDIEELSRTLPELPAARRARFEKEYGLDKKQVELLILEPALAAYFEEAASEFKSISGTPSYSSLVNYLTSDLRGLMNKEGVGFDKMSIQPEHFAHLVSLVSEKKITSRQAKDVLATMFSGDEDPEDILRDEAVKSVSDEGELAAVVETVIAENPAAAADYKKGKSAALQFLVGKAMAKLKGRGKPDILKDIFGAKLK